MVRPIEAVLGRSSWCRIIDSTSPADSLYCPVVLALTRPSWLDARNFPELVVVLQVLFDVLLSRRGLLSRGLWARAGAAWGDNAINSRQITNAW